LLACIPLKIPPCENTQAVLHSPLSKETKADFPPYLLHKKATAGSNRLFEREYEARKTRNSLP
jgi:hypothetical protein